MAGGASSGRQPIVGINVTPLVDVTLVLLVIFMVTAKVIVSHKAMRVDLPRAISGDQVQEVFGVVLGANGATQVNGETLANEDEVSGRAQAAQRKNHQLRAVIQADGAVPYRRAMHVLDLLKRAGVDKIGFAVAPMPATPASTP